MHPLADNIQGLYAIADTSAIDESLLIDKVRQVLAGGCRILQYRDKGNDTVRRLKQAQQLRALCSEVGAVFIINDDAELAMAVNADGVHCGKDDATVSETRKHYPDLMIGASCYNSLERASMAVADGADYLAFGRFFPSSTKPEATPADIVILRQARQQFDKPIVAIGGIIVENAGVLISSGASAVAVINGIFSTTDPYQISQQFCALFNQAG